MNLDKRKFIEAMHNIKDNFENMDEADVYALADVLDNLAGIICPEILKEDLTAAEIAGEYNFATLKCKIDILIDKKIDEERRTLIACTLASLAFPIAEPEMIHCLPKKSHVICIKCQKKPASSPKTGTEPKKTSN
jgi:hypothetical protein